MNINIVIPVLNEEKVLKKSVETTIRYLDQSALFNKYMITIADNGSTDQTGAIVRKLCAQYGNISFFRVSQQGVGLAFREAIKRNTSDIIGYMDVDLATDISHIPQVYETFENESVSIIVGSRLLSESKVYNRTLLREITSRGLNILLKILLDVKFTDAMCGFKFYRDKTAKDLVNFCSDNNGWFYCAEMMIRAEWMGLTVNEIPVKWHDDPDSKVNVGKLSASYMTEIIKLMKIKRKQLH